MSRGLGSLQRRLLAIVKENESIDTLRACRLAFNIQPSSVTDDGETFHLINDAQHASGRRALAGLAKQGLIVNRGRRWSDGRSRWCTPEYAKRVAAPRARNTSGRAARIHERLKRKSPSLGERELSGPR
jgi:hypothetical protein